MDNHMERQLANNAFVVNKIPILSFSYDELEKTTTNIATDKWQIERNSFKDSGEYSMLDEWFNPKW